MLSAEALFLIERLLRLLFRTDVARKQASLVQVKMSKDHSRPKVLVVDDEHVIADTLAMILRASGFDAKAAYSGEESIATAKAFQPDILISDVVMSGMTGIEAAIEIRGMLPACKIMLFSGQASIADLMDGARTNGHRFDIIDKPVHPADLIDRLRRLQLDNTPGQNRRNPREFTRFS